MKIKKLKVKPWHIIGYDGGFYTEEYYNCFVVLDRDMFIGDLHNNIMKCFHKDITWNKTNNERKKMFNL